ncbi:hypothetical protein SARC_15690, partial [Sphaeroforma arctica JP610]
MVHAPSHLQAEKDGAKITTVVATTPGGDSKEVQYTEPNVVGNGSFGVVFQARLVKTNETVAIKKVLQDKRFK